LNLVDESGFGYFWTHFAGKPMRAKWRTPKFGILGKSRTLRDFVGWALAALVITQKARDSLEPLIAPHVEFLPFATIKGKKLSAVNVLQVTDCLDAEASGVKYADDEPERPISVDKFVFVEEKLRPVPIFKVPQSMGHIFVSDEFACAVVRDKLTGAGFDDPENILWVKKPWDRTMDGLPPVKDFDVQVNGQAVT
jgi:hypothetical protein